jgi:hypothetical protein
MSLVLARRWEASSRSRSIRASVSSSGFATEPKGDRHTGTVESASARQVKRTRKAHKVDPKVAAAEALIAEVDAPPGPEAVKRNGDADVQAALQTVASANGHGRETPPGETIDGGAEKADAA